jgi:hypothetical protein
MSADVRLVALAPQCWLMHLPVASRSAVTPGLTRGLLVPAAFADWAPGMRAASGAPAPAPAVAMWIGSRVKPGMTPGGSRRRRIRGQARDDARRGLAPEDAGRGNSGGLPGEVWRCVAVWPHARSGACGCALGGPRSAVLADASAGRLPLRRHPGLDPGPIGFRSFRRLGSGHAGRFWRTGPRSGCCDVDWVPGQARDDAWGGSRRRRIRGQARC